MDEKWTSEALRNFIRSEMKRLGYTSDRGFAEYIGISKSLMSNILNESKSRGVTLRFLKKFAQKTGADLSALLRLLDPNLSAEDLDALLLLDRIRKLSPGEREIVIRMLDAMTRRDQPVNERVE